MTAIYLVKPDCTLKATRQVFEIWHLQQLQRKVLAKMTSHIVVFTPGELSSEAIALALSYRLPILYLDAQGHYIGRIQIQSSCKYLSLQWQKTNHSEFGRSTAEAMVSVTFQNRRAFLLSLSHHHCPTVEMALEVIEWLLDETPHANISELQCYLKTVNDIYYQALREWLRVFVNVDGLKADTFLRLGYFLLEQVVYGFTLEIGLNSDFAHLNHGESWQSLPLVRDMMLEWTTVLVDAVVMRFLVSHFGFFGNGNGNGNGHGSANLFDQFIVSWEQQLQAIALGNKSNKTYRQWIHYQVHHYLRCLWDDSSYRPALLKWNPSLISVAPPAIDISDKSSPRVVAAVGRQG